MVTENTYGDILSDRAYAGGALRSCVFGGLDGTAAVVHATRDDLQVPA